MPRAFKCYWCNKKDYDENMQLVLSGSQKKRYHKDGCFQAFQKDQEVKKKEKKELDELVEVIKEVHDIGQIPKQFYSYIQDIRNGNELFGKIGKKKSKKGYPYSVITETYRDCSDSIQWAKENKNFKNTLQFLKYTRAIIIGNIDVVADQVERKKQQKKEQENRKVNQTNDNYDLDNYNQKDKNDELDISDFL